MKLTVHLLGAEVLAFEWQLPPVQSATPEQPQLGLTEDGAPRVHETHLGASTQIGFVAGDPGWLP